MTRARRIIDELRGDLRGRALAVVIGCLICQIGLGFGYVLAPLAGEIIADMGWTRGEFSFTRLLQIGAMAAASPIVGILTVRHGARVVLITAMVALSLLFIALSRVGDLYAYWALMVVIGVALTGLGDVTVGQTVSQWVARGRGLALGLVFVGSNVGGVLLMPLAVSIADAHGWRTALLALSAIGLLILLPAALLLVRDHRGATQDTPERAGAPPHAVERASDLTLAEARRTRSFWILLFSLFTFFFYFLALLEHLVLYLTDVGMSRADAVARLTTAVGLGIWSKLGLGLVADRVSARAAVGIVYTGLTLSSLLLLVEPRGTLLWLLVVSFGFSYAARDVVYPLIVAHCFGLRNMAPIYGTMMTMLVLGGAGPYFAAAVHDRTGSYGIAFQTFAVLNVITLVALLFIRVERGRAERGRDERE